jgi:hypothetical protein
VRPSVTDQLHQTVRTLREVVLPRVADQEARRAAESAIAGLELVAGAWPRILPFLAWDNVEMTRLLTSRGVAPPSSAVDPLDVEGTHRRNEDLRVQLEAVLANSSRAVDVEIMAHLDQRARRYPLRYVPTLNTGGDAEDG